MIQGSNRATPQQIAYTFIRNGILLGRFAAGERLRAEVIAQELDISRMPVREALRQLDSEGLVTIRLNRGAIVTNLTLSDIRELFEIRAVLEGLAARIAASRAELAQISELEFLIEQMDRAKADRERWIERHDAVHDYLCAISDRRELFSQISKLRARVRPYLLIYSMSHGDPELVGHEHWRFIKPLREHDSEEIERMMRSHVLANGEVIMAGLADSRAFSELQEREPERPDSHAGGARL